MKSQRPSPETGVKELCRRLKIQLDELSQSLDGQPEQKQKLATAREEEERRVSLMEQLKQQIADLSR